MKNVILIVFMIIVGCQIQQTNDKSFKKSLNKIEKSKREHLKKYYNQINRCCNPKALKRGIK